MTLVSPDGENSRVMRVTDLLGMSAPSSGDDTVAQVIDALKLIDFEAILKRDNFVIEGNKYTVKEDVLKNEFFKIIKSIAESLEVMPEEMTYEELFDQIFGNIKKLELSFEKEGAEGLKAVSLVIFSEYAEYSDKSEISLRVEFNSDFLPTLISFDFDESNTESGDSSAAEAEIKLGYDSQKAFKSIEAAIKNVSVYNDEERYFESKNGSDYINAPMTETSNSIINIKIDLGKLSASNGDVISFTQSNTLVLDDTKLAAVAARNRIYN